MKVSHRITLFALLALPLLTMAHANGHIRKRKLQTLVVGDISAAATDEASSLFDLSSYNLLSNTVGSTPKVTAFDGTTIPVEGTFLKASITACGATKTLDLMVGSDGSLGAIVVSGPYEKSNFGCLSVGETASYIASFTVLDTTTNESNTGTFTLTITGTNDNPVLLTSYVIGYDVAVQGGQPTPVGNVFDGIFDADLSDVLQVYSIDEVLVTSFPATAPGSAGGTFTIAVTGDVEFKDTGNEFVAGEESRITVRITDGNGGFVDTGVMVNGM